MFNKNFYLTFFSLLVLISLAFACSEKPGYIIDITGKNPTSNETTPTKLNSVSTSDWQQEWSKSLSNAKKEAKVIIYAGPGMATARDVVLQDMKNKYDIEVEMLIAPSLALVNKIMTERRSGLYIPDVFIMGAEDPVSVLFPNGVAEPLDSLLILPEVKNPALWLNGIIPFLDSKHRAIAFRAEISSRMAYNTLQIAPDEVTSFRDLLNTKLDGKIAMLDPTMAGSGSSWFYLALKEMGSDYLADFVKTRPMLVRDSRQLVEWIARSKYFIGIGVSTALVNDFKNNGAPINNLPPMREAREIRGGVSYTGFFNKAPHPNAARVLINWILSKDGQTSVTKATQIASRRLDVPTDLISSFDVPSPNIKYISRETEEDFLAKKESQQIAQQIFSPLLGR